MKPRTYKYLGVPYVAKGHAAPPSFKSPATCGHCGRTWDDSASTELTPSDAARCPFEYMHRYRKTKDENGAMRRRCVKCTAAIQWYRNRRTGKTILIGGKAYGNCACPNTTWVHGGDVSRQVTHKHKRVLGGNSPRRIGETNRQRSSSK